MSEDTLIETKKDAWCINGQWEEGVCVCEPGYATYFDDTKLTQKYCDADVEAVALLRVTYEPRHYLHLGSMSLTILFTVAAFMVLATALASIIMKVRTRKMIKMARQELKSFEENRVIRDGDLILTFWKPPIKYECINQQKSGEKGSLEAKVVTPYTPQNQGELALKPGMTLTNVELLDRGWCKGRAGEKTGFFPAAFVEMLS